MRLDKKVMVVSSWAPPSIGGSPRLLYNFFSRLDSDTYCLLTSKRNLPSGQTPLTKSLECNYHFYDEGKAFSYKLFPKTFTKETGILEKGFALLRRVYLYFWRNVSMVRNGLSVIKNEKAEILLGMSDYGPALLLTFALSKFSGKPYVLYLFDVYSRNDFGHMWNFVAKVFEPMLLHAAKKIIVLTDPVKESYQAKYGKRYDFEVIRNSGLSDIDHPFIPRVYSPTNTYTILYTGSIYWVQEGALRNLIEAITLIKSVSINLLFTFPLTKALKEIIEKNCLTDRVTVKVVSDDELQSIQRNADILFVPLSWNTENPETIITVFPQKLVEYDVSGRPILVHAPDFSYVARYAKENKLALVIEKNNVEQLKDGILKLINDQAYAAELVRNAKATFFKYHDICKTTEDLKKILDGVLIKNS
jgi:glycosyltransferase involved in cell wall biosynthesis